MSEAEQTTQWLRGEERHEKCRYGRLTESFSACATEAPLQWEPSVTALCTWSLPEPCPPALRRKWGEAIEFDRDCAVCECFEVLP